MRVLRAAFRKSRVLAACKTLASKTGVRQFYNSTPDDWVLGNASGQSGQLLVVDLNTPRNLWDSCTWIRSNFNTDGEIELGPGGDIVTRVATTPDECVALVKEHCPGWDIANLREVGWAKTGCWCQNGRSLI